MDRRTYLGFLAAGLAGTAGCLGSTPSLDDGPTDTPTDTPRPSPPPTGTPLGSAKTLDLGEPFEHPDGWSLTISNARVQRIALRAGTHLDPVAIPHAQYVLADVRADGDVSGAETAGVLPDPGSFEVRLDDRDATPQQRGFWAGQVGIPAGETGTMATPVRVLASDNAAIRWGRPSEPVEWGLTAAHRAAIAHSPTFEVRAFELPDSVEQDSTFEASMTVANVGERDGEFLAELGATTISDTPELRFDVPAGEAVEHVEPVDPHYPTDADELTVVLNWGAGRIDRTLPVV